MIWATVSSRSCFCWLYRASLSLAANNIINLSLVVTIWWCPCVESSLLCWMRMFLLWPGVDKGLFMGSQSVPLGLYCGSACKEFTCNAGDLGLTPVLGRYLEKGKATHSSILAWRIHGLYSPWGHMESDMTEQLSLQSLILCLLIYFSNTILLWFL